LCNVDFNVMLTLYIHIFYLFMFAVIFKLLSDA